MSARNRYDAGLYQVTCPSGRVIEGPPTGRYWVIDENKFKALNADKRIGCSIFEMGLARVRNYADELRGQGELAKLDTGFRVLKIDTSNMNDVYYAPDAVKQDQLAFQTENIKADRTSEDLLFQVLLDWGVDLALPIEQRKIAGKSVFFVDGNALAACFDTDLTEELVKELAKRKPLRAVFRDSSYESDSTKINVAQIFKLLSPETEVKCL